jgi:uncharacterized protein (DUF1800 family)
MPKTLACIRGNQNLKSAELLAGSLVSIVTMALSDRGKCAHLLRRFGLGASEAEIDFYMQGGLNGAIEALLNPTGTSPELDIDDVKNDKGIVNIKFAPVWYGAKILMTRQPLVEKMTLFWHNHFATSGDKVTSAFDMANQNEILRANCLGSFRDLLLNVSKDPAMLIWLDGQDNVKGKPNENFAREIMELFTLGVGNYTERDIQEAARAFTGWGFSRKRKKEKKNGAEFVFSPKLHDETNKTVLGRSGNLGGEDVIDHLCSLPRTAEFITEKIWNWFVYANPAPATLKPFVKGFYDSNLDLKTLLRQIMTSDEFYSERAVRKLIKNPVDFCVSTVRALGLGENLSSQLPDLKAEERTGYLRLPVANGIVGAMKNQGLWLMFPPDVSGWKPGEAWITSATMVERIQWANRLMGTSNKGAISKYPMFNLLASDPSPFGVAKKLCSIFDAPITGAKLVKLSEAAEKAMGTGGLTQKNANAVAASVTRLIFGSPEFQFA